MSPKTPYHSTLFNHYAAVMTGVCVQYTTIEYSVDNIKYLFHAAYRNHLLFQYVTFAPLLQYIFSTYLTMKNRHFS